MEPEKVYKRFILLNLAFLVFSCVSWYDDCTSAKIRFFFISLDRFAEGGRLFESE